MHSRPEGLLGSNADQGVARLAGLPAAARHCLVDPRSRPAAPPLALRQPGRWSKQRLLNRGASDVHAPPTGRWTQPATAQHTPDSSRLVMKF